MSDELTPEQIAAQKAADKEAAAAKKAQEKAERDAKRAAEKAERDAKKEAEKAEREAKKAADLAAKEAKKAEALAAKEASKQPMQNGIRRPKPDGLCGKAWAIFDVVSAKNGAPASIGESMAVAKEQGLNEANVRAEYARWRKFYGISGRVEDPSKAAARAQKEAEKAAKLAEKEAAKAAKEAEKRAKAEAAAAAAAEQPAA